jgi:hypothetical protein
LDLDGEGKHGRATVLLVIIQLGQSRQAET